VNEREGGPYRAKATRRKGGGGGGADVRVAWHHGSAQRLWVAATATGGAHLMGATGAGWHTGEGSWARAT
jgi:hypothetical protein